jgi:hypothetical protein
MSDSAAPSQAPGAAPAHPFTPGPSTPTSKPTGTAAPVPRAAAPSGANPQSAIRNPQLVDAASSASTPSSILNPQSSPRPAGWWKVGGVKGVKADVAKAIQNTAGIPAHWQAALQAEIAAHEAPAVSVSAHFMQENRKVSGGGTTKGKMVMHLSISPIEGWVGG